MKRFYEHAGVTAMAGGVAVTLDGKTVKTPARRLVVLPNELIATAVAREWAAQGETIEPDSMPLMRLAATAIDRVSDNRDAVVDEIAAYGGTDLVCYRAAEPADLKARQDEGWQPLLDWCAARYGARLAVTEGIVAAPQNSVATEALWTAVDGYDPMSLAALHTIATATGSLVIALALAEGRIDAETAWRLSRIDESFQAEHWGVDKETLVQSDRVRAILFASARFLRMCNHGKIVGGSGRGTA